MEKSSFFLEDYEDGRLPSIEEFELNSEIEIERYNILKECYEKEEKERQKKEKIVYIAYRNSPFKTQKGDKSIQVWNSCENHSKPISQNLPKASHKDFKIQVRQNNSTA